LRKKNNQIVSQVLKLSLGTSIQKLQPLILMNQFFNRIIKIICTDFIVLATNSSYFKNIFGYAGQIL